MEESQASQEATPTQPETEQSDSDDLGDAGKKALAVERKLRTAAEKRAKEFEAQVKSFESAVKPQLETRVSLLEEELKNERLNSLKASVAAEKGVPITALVGDTREDLESCADELVAWRGKQEKDKPPKTTTGFKSGATGQDSRLDPMELAAAKLRTLHK